MALIEGWSDRGDVGIAVRIGVGACVGLQILRSSIWYVVTTAKDDVQGILNGYMEGTNKPALAVIRFLLSMTRRGEVVGLGARGGWLGCSASIRLGDRVVPQTSSFRVDDDITAAPSVIICITKLEYIDGMFEWAIS
jgi:hypothetical protein